MQEITLRTRPNELSEPPDRRLRLAFALTATALVLIYVAVAAAALYQQRKMRDVALALYDRAFVANNDVNNARVQFQRFADRREVAADRGAVLRDNELLAPVLQDLAAAAQRAGEPALRDEREAARTDVFALEADLDDAGPEIASRLKATQTTLDTVAAHAMARGLQARAKIETTALNCTLLLLAAMVAGAGLGVVTLTVMRRRIAVSTMKRLSRLTNYDAVTGMPNRNLLTRRLADSLEGARRGDGRVAVATIDLDRFKQVNDALGHQIGDRLLREAGERIRRVTRPEDTCARFGGDEFVALLSNIVDANEAAAIAERLVATLSAPFEFDGQRVLAGASVGVALSPQHGDTAEELLRNSDLALYQAKGAGKGTFRFFEPELSKNLQARRLMEIDLRETLEADRLDVYFQPVIEVASGAIVACEALARWRRLGHGFVSPAEFIPLAEETGLILPLGEAVLRKACREAKRWPAHVRVSVNLSARQFQADDLVDVVADSLLCADLPASRLELEITESVLVADKPRVLAALTALKQLGVHIALDDFGTGYSSLSYLSSFPFDRIKIDRSFVTGVDSRPEAAAIVRAVTGLADTLGMSTTAEGVETDRDLAWLRTQRCELAQGFLVSKPIPPREFEALLQSWSARVAA